MFYKDDRLAVLIDGTNFSAAAKALSFDVDFNRLRGEFSQRGRLMRIGYYTRIVDNEEHLPIRPLLDWLSYNGFHVVTRSAREFTDSNGRRRIKGTTNTNLIVDAMEIAHSLDHLVLISGDSDFVPLVETLQRRGLRVSVASTLKSTPPMASDDLRRAADNFIEINDWLELMSKRREEVAG